MRICHIITTLVYGGAERLLVEIANHHARNHEVHVIYLKGEPHLKGAFSPSIGVHLVPLGPLCVPMLRRKIRSLAPDLVHTHLGHADFLGLLACAGLPVRRFCTMHNVWFKFDWRDRIFFAVYRLLFATVARDCNLIAISESLGGHIRDVLGVKPGNVHLLYNGIPPVRVPEEKASIRRRHGIPEDAFCVLFVGRLRIQKSVDTLLRAVPRMRAAIPSLRVLLFGEGPEEASLRSLHAELGLDGAVRFAGTTREPEALMKAADCFVLPSVFEGLPLVLLEAFRAGLPIVATRIDGPIELIQEDRNGILVEARNPDALADGVVRLHADPALRARLGDGGLASFEGKFSIDHCAASLESLYRGDRG